MKLCTDFLGIILKITTISKKKKKKKMFRYPSAWDIICNYVYLYANCFTLICVFINKVPIMLFIGD